MSPISIAIVVVVAAASEPSAAEQAAELFASAEAEFSAGRYEEALAGFREADVLLPHPATKFHMARCLEELGRLREAWELYGLVAEATEVSPDERSAAAQRRADIRSRLAVVRVQGHDGGELMVDGVVACTTPCTALADPGPHDVQVVWPDRTVDQHLELREAEIHDLDVAEPPPPPVVAPLDTTPPLPDRPPPRAARWPTVLTWIGIPLAGVGTIGALGFGFNTLAIKREHDSIPTEQTRERGIRSRTLTNVSIGIAIAGGILVVADAIRYGVAKRRRRG